MITFGTTSTWICHLTLMHIFIPLHTMNDTYACIAIKRRQCNTPDFMAPKRLKCLELRCLSGGNFKCFFGFGFILLKFQYTPRNQKFKVLIHTFIEYCLWHRWCSFGTNDFWFIYLLYKWFTLIAFICKIIYAFRTYHRLKWQALNIHDCILKTILCNINDYPTTNQFVRCHCHSVNQYTHLVCYTETTSTLKSITNK